MADDEIRSQVLAACRELVFVARDLPSGSVPRFAIIGLAETLRQEYDLTDTDKRQMAIAEFKRVQPVAKSEFPEFLDFSRAESKRIIDSLIASALIEEYQERSEDGRPRVMLREP